MNARKMPSGSWQSVIYIGKVDGKKKYVTVTESSRNACLLKAAQVKGESKKDVPKLTVLQAAEKYISAKEGVLSPATVAGYKAVVKRYIGCRNGSRRSRRAYRRRRLSMRIASWLPR